MGSTEATAGILCFQQFTAWSMMCGGYTPNMQSPTSWGFTSDSRDTNSSEVGKQAQKTKTGVKPLRGEERTGFGGWMTHILQVQH